jgi:hypothetical protein
MRLRIFGLMLFLAVHMVATSCFADSTIWVDDSSGEIGTVNTANGSVSLIGNAGVVLTDIAFSPDGVLYGIDFNDLYTINQTTGAATLVGPLGIPDAVNALVFGSDGTLYTAGVLEGGFYTVDSNSGAASLVGYTGFDSAGDLAFVNGTLYLTTTSSELLSINLTNGAGTSVGNMGVANMYGLATPDNSTLFGVAGTNLYTIDPSTGEAAVDLDFAGNGLGDANGSAFYSEATGAATGGTSPVPEPPAFSMLLCGLFSMALLAWRQESTRSRSSRFDLSEIHSTTISVAE